MRIPTLLFIVLAFTASAQDNNLIFKQFDIEDGLSSRFVSACIQDTAGYMWFGTHNGLNRFDGLTFRLYTHQENDPFSIADNHIYAIFQLNNGDIWIRTNKGISKYDVLYDRFINIGTNKKTTKGLSNSYVSSIIEMPDGNTYVLAYDGINLMDRKQLTFEHYPLETDHEPIEHFTCALPFDNKHILMGSYSDGLFLFNVKTKNYSKLSDRYPALHEIPQSISALLLVNHKLWIGSRQGLYTLCLNTRSLTAHKHDTGVPLSVRTRVNTLYLDNDSNIWIGTMADGLLRYSYDCDCFAIFKEDANNPNSLSRNAISAIYQDRQGILWLGTSEGGLNYSHPIFNNFSTVSHQIGNDNSLISNQVSCFQEDAAGDLWIGTENGLSLQTGENTFFNFSTQNSQLRHNKIQSLCELMPGKILIGHRTGIDILNKKTADVRGFQFADRPNLTNQWVHKIALLTEDKFVVLFASGLLVLYDMTKKQSLIIHDSRDGIGDSDFVVNADKGLCFLQDNAIFYYNQTNQKKALIWESPATNELSHIALAPNRETICVAERNSPSVFSYNLRTQQSHTFTNNHCRNCHVRSMQFDSKGDLWVGTSNGLFCLDLEKDNWQYYNKQDGLSSNMCNKSIMNGQNNRIYLSTNKGYTVFQPERIIKNLSPPKLKISDVFLFNKRLKPGHHEALPQNMNTLKKLRFDYNQSITLHFSVLNYLYPHKNKVFVLLEGHDKDWVQLGQNHKISYTNLEPKNYTLYYKASNNEGIWSKTHRLKLQIKPPFWESLWFKLLLTAILISGIFLIIRLRLYRVKREKTLLEAKVKRRTEALALANQQLKESNSSLNQMVALKNKFFSIVAHDLKNPFHAISAFSELLINNFETIDKHKALSYIEEIRNSSTEAADFLENLYTWARLQNNTYHFSPMPVHLNSVVAKVFDLLQLNARNKNIKLLNTVAEDIFVLADEAMLFICIQNLVSNSIKFTYDTGKVRVSSEVETDGILLRVSDSGIGMTADILDTLFKVDKHVSTPGTNGEKGTGLGLVLVREFMDKNGGTVMVQSKPGQGSSFLLRFKKVESADDMLSTKPGILAEETNARQAKITIPPTGALHGEYKVLIAEDMQSARLHLIAVLETYFVVFNAPDGKRAYEMVIKEKPDLIISDVAMPFMDGIELCKLIKTSPAVSHIPIILLTAKDTVNDKLAGLGVGADDYVVKPFEAAVLLARINNLIISRKKLREKFALQSDLQADQLANTDVDKMFFKKAVDIIHQHLDREDFTVSVFVNLMGSSRSSIYDKIKAVTNMSVNEFIKTIRLKKAAMLIRESQLTISEIAYKVGFKDTSHFTKVFKKQYGKPPTEYRGDG